MKKNKINNIQQYFVFLFFIVNQLFESQRTKLETGIGYNFCAYQYKTKYRLESLFISLKSIIEETVNFQELFVFLKKQYKIFQKNFIKNVTCIEFDNKKYTKYLTDKILKNHCRDLLSQFTKSVWDFEDLYDSLLSAMFENVYEYQGIIEKITFKKYGKFVFELNFYKQKAITQRLKKKTKKTNTIS